MDKSHLFFMVVMAAIVIIVGLRTIITRETTLVIRLWGSGDVDDQRRHDGGGYSESTQTGFIAVLVGMAEIGMGIHLLAKALA